MSDGLTDIARKAIADCEICQNPDAYWGSHYHCAKCGEECGMMAHYAGEGKPWSCETDTGHGEPPETARAVNTRGEGQDGSPSMV